MPRFSHEGRSLWYGTIDAPAPEGVAVGRTGVRVTVGVQPPHVNNTVTIRYRVDGGSPQLDGATMGRTDYERNAQYFTATFPDFGAGTTVEYLPVLSCVGSQVPDPATAGAFPSSFHLHGPPAARTLTLHDRDRRAAPEQRADRLPVACEYLATVRVHSTGAPEIIGPTPEGVRVNWRPLGGEVRGPALNAKVRPGGVHGMMLRPDGIGILDVMATLETDDGALLWISYSGVLELGDDGYQQMLATTLSGAFTVRIAPRLLTGHPKYLWLNRLQCLGVGTVIMAKHLYTYDLYAVR